MYKNRPNGFIVQQGKHRRDLRIRRSFEAAPSQPHVVHSGALNFRLFRFLAAQINHGFDAEFSQTVKTLAARGISGFSDMQKAHAEHAPLGRNVEVSEVGSTGVFLASDASSGITGEVIYVDCGYNIMGF